MPIAEDWCRPFRVAGEVEVFHVDLTPDPAREAAAFEMLDDPERGQWRRFLHAGPRRRYALCRAALRTILRRQFDCGNERIVFGASPYKKPFALVRGRPAPISFNVSHSGDHGLVAIAPTGRVGIDVEERSTRHELDGPVAAVLGPDERSELSRLCGDRKVQLFFCIWTIKEALIKALGTGHYTDVSQFQVPANMRGGESTGLFRFPHLPSIAWRLEDLGNRDFAAALAHEMYPGTHPQPHSIAEHMAIPG